MTPLRNFSFGGIDFSPWYVISKVTMPFLSKENNFFQVGNASGSRLLNSRLLKNEIKIEGTIINQRSGMTVQGTKDEMIRALNSEGTKQLIFNQLSDRYFNAIFDGSIEYDATDDDLTELELTFSVPEGVAYAIETDYFTNADPATENLCLDSEFENLGHYWKDFNWRGAKYDGSNTLFADFTDLVTIYGKENWLPKTTESTRPVNVTVGDSVSFGVLVNIEKLPTDGTTRPCSVILEERSKVGGEILKRHSIDASVVENQWQTIKKTIQITNEKTTALCLTEGVRGNTRLKISRPQFNLGLTLKPYTPSKLTVSDQVEVTHYGTWKATPRVEVTMQGENGLIGLVNSNSGVLQYGDPGDVDSIRVAGRHKVVNYGWRGDTLPEGVSLNDKTMPSTYPNFGGNAATPNIVQGNVKWDGGEAIYPVFTGVGDIKVWHGPTVSFQIPKSSNNTNNGDFISAQRLRFENSTNVKTARGRVEYVIADENKQLFMAVIVRDSSTLNNELIVEFWYKNKMVKSTSLSRKTFNGNFFEIHMDRLNGNTKLRWCFSQIKALNPANDGAFTSHDHEFTMNFPERELTNAIYEKCWFMRYSNQHHNYMYWTDSKLYWTNENVRTNINNLFDDKDLVEVDIKNRKILVNGVEDRTLHKLGNEYEKFQLDYGKHTIQVIPSEWAVTPIVGVTLRRVFL